MSDDSGYAARVSLRVRHPTLAPAAVTAALGLTPSTSWAAGEVTERVVRPATYWTAVVAERAADLPVVLAAVVESLRPRAEFLAEVTRTGGRCELFAGVFLDRSGGDTLPAALLLALGELRLDLSLDVYCPGVTTDAGAHRPR